MRIQLTILSALSAMVAAAESPAPQPPNAKPKEAVTAKMQTKVFDIADILSREMPSLGLNKEQSNATKASLLTELITSMVRPYKWEREGGKGKFEFIEISDSLVVTNSPEALVEVRNLIESLRKLPK